MKSDDLKAWRLAHELTQQQLAQRLGVTPNTMARWERGEIPPPNLLPVALRGVELDLWREREAESRAYRRRWTRQERSRESATNAGTFLHSDDPKAVVLTIDTARFRQLRQLCHPDKHNGSPTANDITAWLNSEAQ